MCGDAAFKATMPVDATVNASLVDLSNVAAVKFSLLSQIMGDSVVVVVVFTSRISSQTMLTIFLCLPIGFDALSMC